MNKIFAALFFTFVVVPLAVAQEDAATASDSPAIEQPETTTEAPKIPKTLKTPETPKPAVAVSPVVAKKAVPPPKELTACAKAFTPLAEGYKKAYEDMQNWIADVDAQTAAAEGKVQKLQEQIQQNESAITKAKLEGDSKKERELSRENKQVWIEFSAAKKEKSALCAGFARGAVQKVKDFAAEASTMAQELKSRLK